MFISHRIITIIDLFSDTCCFFVANRCWYFSIDNGCFFIFPKIFTVSDRQIMYLFLCRQKPVFYYSVCLRTRAVSIVLRQRLFSFVSRQRINLIFHHFHCFSSNIRYSYFSPYNDFLFCFSTENYCFSILPRQPLFFIFSQKTAKHFSW